MASYLTHYYVFDAVFVFGNELFHIESGRFLMCQYCSNITQIHERSATGFIDWVKTS